jgi:hypothetical protein
MARTYAKSFLDMWDAKSDFRDLTEGAQRLYMMLFSHPQLSACGVIPLQPRRWAGTAKDLTERKVDRYLAELEGHPSRKVIIDRNTDEVFVRAFIRRDGGANNPNISKAIRRAIDVVESDAIRDAAEAEYERARRHPPEGSSQHPPEDPPEDPSQRSGRRPPEGDRQPTSSSSSSSSLQPQPHPSSLTSSSTSTVDAIDRRVETDQRSDHDEDGTLVSAAELTGRWLR